MPVYDVVIDRATLTLTILARYDAPPRDVFALYEDPRRLERVWGPPTHPATFVEHALRPGMRSTYYMTGPDGTRYYGWWVVRTVDAPRRFEFDDGYADSSYNALPGQPVGHHTYTFAAEGGGTHVTYASSYETEDDLDRALDIGVVEATTQAAGQVDAVLAEMPTKHQVTGFSPQGMPIVPGRR